MSDITAKALRALLTDECHCEDGNVWRDVPCIEHAHGSSWPAGASCTMQVREQVDHVDCGGRGWLPKEATVERLSNIDLGMTYLFKDEARNLIVDWLEAEDE